MDKKEFMNQKVSEMSVEELKSAVEYKKNEKVSSEELKAYFEDIRKDIKTLAQGKEASLKKWQRILKDIDRVDWSIALMSTVWNNCGLCEYKNQTTKTDECDGCKLFPHCDHSWINISSDEPLYKILKAIRNYHKPNPEDIKAFIKHIEDIQLFKVGDKVKLIEEKRDVALWENGEYRRTRNLWDTPEKITEITKDGKLKVTSIAKYNPLCFKLVEEEWVDVTEACEIVLRSDGKTSVIQFRLPRNVFHLGINGFFFPNPKKIKAESDGTDGFRIMKKVD